MATQGTGLNISIGNHTITFTITNFDYSLKTTITALLVREYFPLADKHVHCKKLVFNKFTNRSALNFDMKFLAINQNLVKKYSQYFSF